MKKTIGITILLIATITQQGLAARKIVLDARIDEAIEEFYAKTSAGKNLAPKIKGDARISFCRESRNRNRRRIR